MSTHAGPAPNGIPHPHPHPHVRASIDSVSWKEEVESHFGFRLHFPDYHLRLRNFLFVSLVRLFFKMIPIHPVYKPNLDVNPSL